LNALEKARRKATDPTNSKPTNPTNPGYIRLAFPSPRLLFTIQH
jgi:hypothetical protein